MTESRLNTNAYVVDNADDDLERRGEPDGLWNDNDDANDPHERTLHVWQEHSPPSSWVRQRWCLGILMLMTLIVGYGLGIATTMKNGSFIPNSTSSSSSTTTTTQEGDGTDGEISCYRPVVDLWHAGQVSTQPQGLSLDEPRELHGLQGLAMLPRSSSSNTNDPNMYVDLYQGHTRGLRQIQLRADDFSVVQVLQERVYNMTTDFPSIRLANGTALPLVHFGGITVIQTPARGKQVLLAAHTVLDPITSRDGAGIIVGVDATTFDFDNSTTAAYNPHAANDWVTVDYSTGIGYTGTFFNVTHALRFRVDTLEDLEPLQFAGQGLPKEGINYVQSATVQGSTLLLGTNDFQGSLYHIDIGSGRVIGRQSLLLGNEMDGLLSISSHQLLIGFNRHKSHEHIPLESVILLEATREPIGPRPCGGAYIHFEN